MFSKIAIITAAIGLSNSVAALGYARVVNNCDFDAYVRSVGKQEGPIRRVQPKQMVAELYHYGDEDLVKLAALEQRPGRTYKVARTEAVGGAELDFGYAIQDGGARVFYSLSSVNGNPYDGLNVEISSSDSSCPSIGLNQGSRDCSSDADTILTLCATS